MAKVIIPPLKEYPRIKVNKLKISPKDYRRAWLNFERLGRKINKLWKVKKYSFEILREERE